MKNRFNFGVPVMFLVILSFACSQFSLGSNQQNPLGTIVYQSDQYGNFELFSVDIRSNRLLRLTNNSTNDVSPTYISATNQIGYVSNQNNAWNIYIIDRFGENHGEILFDENTAVDYPDWSIDGNYIVASLVKNCAPPATQCIYDIYSMNADGSNLTNLTESPSSDWVPNWSPDGQKIAFSSDRDGDGEIYIMDKDGSNLKKLTDNSVYDGRPRWSPDGKLIAFETDRDGVDWDIYVMNTDGSNPMTITNNTANEFSFSWSPDGNWLVYVSNLDGDNEIFIIGVDGQNQIRLTNNNYNDMSPIWLP